MKNYNEIRIRHSQEGIADSRSLRRMFKEHETENERHWGDEKRDKKRKGYNQRESWE